MFKSILLLILLTINFGCGKKELYKTYRIEGEIENLESGEVVLEKLDLVTNERAFVAKKKIVDGRFSFTDTLSAWGLHSLVIHDSVRIPFFIEPGKIHVNIPDHRSNKADVKAGINNDLLKKHMFAFNKAEGVKLIEKYPNTIFGAFTTYYVMMNNNLEGDTLGNLIAKLTGEARESVYMPHIEKVAESIFSTAIGKKAPDFAVLDSSGQEIRLSDLKGKYVLLDFWTSWCKPCREANPQWKVLYQKYKSEKLEFFGVSFDVKCQPWKNAVKKDDLNWKNGCNCTGWDYISDLYGVKSVPQTFLIHPDGTILDKNIKPDNFESIFANYIKK